MKSIPFYTTDIKIIPHSASIANHVGREVSIAEFAGEETVSLYEKENGEYLCRTQNRFIEGKLIT